MSAAIAVAKSGRVEILTDSIRLRAQDGVIEGFAPKASTRMVPNTVIAFNGLHQPAFNFVRLAGERCASFDALVDAGNALWSDVQVDSPHSYALVFAGWSEQRQAFELWSVASGEAEFSESCIFAAGPTDDAAEALIPFVNRFNDDTSGFDAVRDGLALMHELRGFHRQFGNGAIGPALGGRIELTTLRRESITAEIIHRWTEDRIGSRVGQ